MGLDVVDGTGTEREDDDEATDAEIETGTFCVDNTKDSG